MDRTKNLYKNRHLADCKFRLPDGQLLEANKTLLSFYSPVFYSMFFGGFLKEEIVEIIDADYEIFDKFLMYIYTKHIDFVDATEAEAIFYLARKYEVIDLEYNCLKYIREGLNVETVCLAYEVARLFDDTELEKVALDIICNKTGQLLCSKGFQEADLTTVTAIVSLKMLNIASEIEIFNAIQRYSMLNEVSQDEIKPVMQQIQFLRMTQEEFVKGPMTSELLTNEEKLKIMSSLTINDSNGMPESFTTAVDRICLDRSDENIFRMLNEIRSSLDPPFFTCPHYTNASINHILIKCDAYHSRRWDMLTKLTERGVYRKGPDSLYTCINLITYKNGLDIESRKIFCDYIRSHQLDLRCLLKLSEEDIECLKHLSVS